MNRGIIIDGSIKVNIGTYSEENGIVLKSKNNYLNLTNSFNYFCIL